MNDFGNIDPDLQLFGAVRKGDRSAFEQLFQKYYTDLCHYAWTYLDEKSETEDAVQDVFIYIWNNRETIRLQESFRGYLFSAVKHRVLNILKHQLVERTHSRLLSEYWDDLLNPVIPKKNRPSWNKFSISFNLYPSNAVLCL